jgi:hypothetical protein
MVVSRSCGLVLLNRIREQLVQQLQAQSNSLLLGRPMGANSLCPGQKRISLVSLPPVPKEQRQLFPTETEAKNRGADPQPHQRPTQETVVGSLDLNHFQRSHGWVAPGRWVAPGPTSPGSGGIVPEMSPRSRLSCGTPQHSPGSRPVLVEDRPAGTE